MKTLNYDIALQTFGSLELAIIVLISIGLAIGFITALFGVGGGFFYTPFFHSVFKISALDAVSTSLGQMPLTSLGGVIRFLREDKIIFKDALFLLPGSILMSQLIAQTLGKVNHTTWGRETIYGSISNADAIVITLFVALISPVAVYNLKKAGLYKKPELEIEPSSGFLQSNAFTLIVGLGFGFVQATIGIGGGFLSVPFLTYGKGREPAQAVATSLFCILITSIFLTIINVYLDQVYLLLSCCAAIGGIIGSMLGAKFVINMEPQKILKSLGYFQLLVIFIYVGVKLYL